MAHTKNLKMHTQSIRFPTTYLLEELKIKDPIARYRKAHTTFYAKCWASADPISNAVMQEREIHPRRK